MKSIHYAVAAALLAVGVMPQAHADTQAGTKISNTADVTYSVGNKPQTAVKSGSVEFVVDRKVDLTVTRLSASPATVNTGASSVYGSNVLIFQVTNNSNDKIDVGLALNNVAAGLAVPGGNDDGDTDTANLKMYLDNPTTGTVGEWDAGDTLVTYLDSLAMGASAKVFVVADPMDNDLVDGTLVGINLTGSAYSAYDDSLAAIGDAGHVENTALGAKLIEQAADTNAGVQNVFAEAADTDGNQASPDPKENGQDKAYGTFKVQAAKISVSKAVVPYWDAFNGGDSPRALPGAVMLYCITINNANNAQPATDVTVSDTVLTGQTFLDGHTFAAVAGKSTPPAFTSTSTIRFTDSDQCTAAAWEGAAYTEDTDAADTAGDSDGDLNHSGNYDATNPLAPKVTTKVNSLAANSYTTTMFMVTITP